MVDVCFVVMPFGSIRRPALGVSLLKAALKNIGVSSKIHYFNFKLAERIGLNMYERVAETSLDSPLIGELIFSVSAFNTCQFEKQKIKNILEQIFRSKHQNMTIDKLTNEIIRAQELVPEFLDDCEYNIIKERPLLVGFTSTFEQNLASIALAKMLKGNLQIPIVFGGSNCEGDMGSSLLKCSPWIDFACSGEGDISFINFVKGFLKGEHYKKIDGILSRNSSAFEIAVTNPVINMDALPFPEFDEFFTAFSYFRLKKSVEPELVLETSRGCWWGEKFQCTFCGLNGSTMKYRSKSVLRVLDELKFLVDRYGITRIVVVDNILNLKYIDSLFPEICAQEIKAKIFYETKANITKQQLVTMRKGGVDAIQPGIESLSDIILNIMKKGVVAFQNIQLLKWCKELDVLPVWNVIWGFPGEPEEEYRRMAELVPLIAHLYPPTVFGKLVLDRFSPYFVQSLENGILNVRPWIAYKFLYPLTGEDLYKIAYHFDFDYSDQREPELYTMGLKRELLNWKKLWENGNDQRMSGPILKMRHNGDRIEIEDTRPCSSQRFCTLRDDQAKAYNICETAHTFQSILVNLQQRSSQSTEKNLREILSNMVNRKLMLCNQDKYLSLAVPFNDHQ